MAMRSVEQTWWAVRGEILCAGVLRCAFNDADAQTKRMLQGKSLALAKMFSEASARPTYSICLRRRTPWAALVGFPNRRSS
jgi:hypothetical protein